VPGSDPAAGAEVVTGRDGGTLRVVSANVNGIRAAARRGGLGWLDELAADVIALQEVRASRDELSATLAGAGMTGWRITHAEAAAKGRAGVAVLSRAEPVEVRTGFGPAGSGAESGSGSEFAEAGRWVEADLPTDAGVVTIASTYVHTGEAGTARQDEKHRFLDAMTERMRSLRKDSAGSGGDRAGRQAVVTGDLNVAHREIDLKNWRGNLKKAGFLPSERDYFDRWLDDAHPDGGWVDVHRALAGDGPGPYTWWSWRGQAFDNDTGWRIDYQLATAGLAERAVKADVGRAASYAQRWSDHAAVIIDYAL
jgi:exodeoxyribonuclease III